jgi:hypothetical protein
MKVEKELEKVINEEIVFDDELRKEVKFIDNERFLTKVFHEGISYTYLLLCKLNNQSIEVLQIVDEEVSTDNNDIIYSVVANENLIIKLKWTSFGDIDAYDIRAYEYHFEDDKLLLGEIRYTDLVEKPDMSDKLDIGLTLIDAIDNNYYPYSDIQECFKSLCIIWGEEIDWELYQEVRLSLEEDSEIEVENYLLNYFGI